MVAAALIDDTGRVLVQQRPAGGTLAGLWEFPGGKPEPGESPVDALVRELAEELGVLVDKTELRPTTFVSEPLDRRHLILLLYVCRRWRGTPRALHATELRWALPADLKLLPMPPADVPLVLILESIV